MKREYEIVKNGDDYEIRRYNFGNIKELLKQKDDDGKVRISLKGIHYFGEKEPEIQIENDDLVAYKYIFYF